ncbi:hypothetical protein TNCV_83431 [Trichonephila clavipes]|nr:hypothetical protein TNCV_83431 [Trichonephila clavipes]
MCTYGVEKKIHLPNAPPVTPEDKHKIALLALGSKCPLKDFFCYFKNNELFSDRIESNAFEMPVEQETDNNTSRTSEGQMIKGQPITNSKREAILNELKRIEDVVKIADLAEESGDRLLKTLGKIQASQDLKSIYVCEVEGAIASPLSIPPERAMSPTGERSDEGRNIRTKQNPLGPQERQTPIGRAVITLKKQ